MKQIECCVDCGIKLFEVEDGAKGQKKIFRSFSTKFENGREVYRCVNCYKCMNKENANDSKREDD